MGPSQTGDHVEKMFLRSQAYHGAAEAAQEKANQLASQKARGKQKPLAAAVRPWVKLAAPTTGFNMPQDGVNL